MPHNFKTAIYIDPLISYFNVGIPEKIKTSLQEIGRSCFQVNMGQSTNGVCGHYITSILLAIISNRLPLHLLPWDTLTRPYDLSYFQTLRNHTILKELHNKILPSSEITLLSHAVEAIRTGQKYLDFNPILFPECSSPYGNVEN